MQTKTNKKKLRIILILTISILLVASLEALITVKSLETFNSYRHLYDEGGNIDFVTYVLTKYLAQIIVAVILAIFLFYISHKTKLNRNHILILSGSSLIGLVNIIFTFNFKSVFYYLLIVLYILLFFTIMSYQQNTD